MIHVNEAGYQITKHSFLHRLKFLWRVIKYVIKPTVYIDVHREVDQFGRIMVSGWIKRPGDEGYKYHYVSYDGKNAPVGFIDGHQVLEKSNEPLTIGRTIKHEQIENCGGTFQLPLRDGTDQDE